MNPDENNRGPADPNNDFNPVPNQPPSQPLPPTSGGQPAANPSPLESRPPAPTEAPRSVYPGQTGGVYSPPLTTQLPPEEGGKKSKKKLIIALTAFAVILLLGAGYVFGFYIPNKPENVWKTGLDRSGDAIEQIVNKATETEKLNQIKNSEITGSLEFSSQDLNFNGNLVSKLNETKSDSNLDISFQDNTGQETSLNLKALTHLPEGKKYPNIFFQFNGASQLGLNAFIPELSKYESKWIGVDSDYLEELSNYGGGTKPEGNQKNITSEEYAEIVRTVSATSSEYLFTSDPEKAVIENRGFVGKEEVDGLKTYHYQAAVNEANAKKFCVALSERVIVLPAWQKLFELDEESTQKMKDSAKITCEGEWPKDPDDDGVFDVWVDSKYKLIYKIRDYTDKDKKDYFEIGQKYTGGDDILFFANVHDDESQFDLRLELGTNLETNITKVSLSASQKSEAITGLFGPFEAKASFEAKPFDGEINVDEPEGTIKLQDILESLGVNSTSGGSLLAGQQAKAKEAKREADINASRLR